MRFTPDAPRPDVSRPESAPFPVFGLTDQWAGERTLGAYEYSGGQLSFVRLQHRDFQDRDTWTDVVSFGPSSMQPPAMLMEEALASSVRSRLDGARPTEGSPVADRTSREEVVVTGVAHEIEFHYYPGFALGALILSDVRVVLIVERATARPTTGPIRLEQVQDLRDYT